MTCVPGTQARGFQVRWPRASRSPHPHPRPREPGQALDILSLGCILRSRTRDEVPDLVLGTALGLKCGTVPQVYEVGEATGSDAEASVSSPPASKATALRPGTAIANTVTPGLLLPGSFKAS